MDFLFYEMKRYKNYTSSEWGLHSSIAGLFEIKSEKSTRVIEISKVVFESGGTFPLRLQNVDNNKQWASIPRHLRHLG